MKVLEYVLIVMGVNKTRLASELGITKQTISDWTKYKRDIPVERAIQIGNILNVNPLMLNNDMIDISEKERLKIHLTYALKIDDKNLITKVCNKIEGLLE